ncbi:MAG TPA: hypothetical protein VMW53_07360 [archaeon]|nr:hypothetical protein [archaeon]
MERDLIVKNDHYMLLVEQIKATITEAVHNSRWFLVEGYWNVGKLIRENFTGNLTNQLQTLAVDVGISERTLWYALQFFDKFPLLDEVPEGKNISWNKIVTKYLPEKQGEFLSYEKRIGKTIKSLNSFYKKLPDEIPAQQKNRILELVNEIADILSAEPARVFPGGTSNISPAPDEKTESFLNRMKEAGVEANPSVFISQVDPRIKAEDIQKRIEEIKEADVQEWT